MKKLGDEGKAGKFMPTWQFFPIKAHSREEYAISRTTSFLRSGDSKKMAFFIKSFDHHPVKLVEKFYTVSILKFYCSHLR